MFLKNVVLYEIYSKKSQWPNSFGTSLCIIQNKFVIFHSFTITKLNLIFYKVIFNTILISNIFRPLQRPRLLISIIFSSNFLFGHPYKINPVVDQWDLQAPFLAWFLSWKIYSECPPLQGIISVYFTMNNAQNLERKSSADRITCFLPL